MALSDPSPSRGRATIWLVLGLAFTVSGAGTQGTPSEIASALDRLPVYFVENRGVYARDVTHFVRARDTTFCFTPDGVTMRQHAQGEQAAAVRVSFIDARRTAPVGERRRTATFSHFRGAAEAWKSGLRSFAAVCYRQLWAGIDLRFHGTSSRLKYEFRVSPGVDPGVIKLGYTGATAVRLTPAGALEIETPARTIEESPPIAFQVIDGARVPVPAKFVLDDSGHVGFSLAAYDPHAELVIDPGWIAYCGYLGGSTRDWIKGVAVDSAGYAYVTGSTDSSPPSFPVRVGPDLTYNGPAWQPNMPWADIFVAKIDLAGNRLVYCGYIGGSEPEKPGTIAVDASGSAYVTGSTRSDETTFPVKRGPSTTYRGGLVFGDAFIAKINPAGTSLDYCGYIGGAAEEEGTGVAVDTAGNAYIAGWTASDERSFPVRIGPDLTFNGPALSPQLVGDAFIAKVVPDGSSLAYCGYIGGNIDDYGNDVAIDSAGRAYVVGHTLSTTASFPLKVGPSAARGATFDAFVARVSASGTGLDYCGYIPGNGLDIANAVAVDATGAAYVHGGSSSTDLPVVVGPGLAYSGGSANAGDTFVAKVDPSGARFAYCGYLGGALDEYAGDIAVDRGGRAYVCGATLSDETTFPVVRGPALVHAGSADAFVARVSPSGAALEFSGFIGGQSHDSLAAIAIGPKSSVYLGGATRGASPGLPIYGGPAATFGGGRSDGLVCKLDFAEVFIAGRPNPGQRLDVVVNVPSDGNAPFLLASSLGKGPIPLGPRRIDLTPDTLAHASSTGALPAVFRGYQGVLDASGRRIAHIDIPPLAILIGLRIHTAALTFDQRYPWGIKTITAPATFAIAR